MPLLLQHKRKGYFPGISNKPPKLGSFWACLPYSVWSLLLSVAYLASLLLTGWILSWPSYTDTQCFVLSRCVNWCWPASYFQLLYFLKIQSFFPLPSPHLTSYWRSTGRGPYWKAFHPCSLLSLVKVTDKVKEFPCALKRMLFVMALAPLRCSIFINSKEGHFFKSQILLLGSMHWFDWHMLILWLNLAASSRLRETLLFLAGPVKEMHHLKVIFLN